MGRGMMTGRERNMEKRRGSKGIEEERNRGKGTFWM
jgi:hypothetical protein